MQPRKPSSILPVPRTISNAVPSACNLVLQLFKLSPLLSNMTHDLSMFSQVASQSVVLDTSVLFINDSSTNTYIYTWGPCLPVPSPVPQHSTTWGLVHSRLSIHDNCTGSLYLAVTFQDIISRHMQHPRGQGVADSSFPGCRAQRHSPRGELLLRARTLKAEKQAAEAPTLPDLRLHLQSGVLRVALFPGWPSGGAGGLASPTSLLMKQ